MSSADTRVLETALDQAYALLNQAAALCVLPPDLQIKVRRVLPPRFEESISHSRKTEKKS